MKSVYAYIRVSTVKQGERGSSLQEQRAAIEGYAQRFGLTISAWFEELETAAKRGRRVFGQMLKALSKGDASGVVIHKIDRSARNLRDWADLGELIDAGIDVHFAHEGLDLHSRGGRLSADIQAVVAADFIRNLRDEVRKGFIGRLKQGLYPLRAPIGYSDQGRGMPKIPDPMTAPLVRRAFEMYATGPYNVITLGDELYRLGLRNRNGGRVTKNGISTILNNPFYIGLIRIARTGETYQGVHEPLVSKSLFDEVQDMLSGNRRTTGWKHSFLYRRMLRCAHCGYSLIAERQKGHVYYRCHTRECPKTNLREEFIDTSVCDGLAKLRFTNEDYRDLRDLFGKLKSTSATHDAKLVQAERLHIAQLDDRLARVTDAYIDRMIDKAVFEQRKAALLHDRAALLERLQGLEGGEGATAARCENFLELLKALSDNDKLENPLERRELLKDVTSNVLVDQNKLVFAWQSPFDLIAERPDSYYGELKRDRPRTSSSKDNKHTQAIAAAIIEASQKPLSQRHMELIEKYRQKTAEDVHKDKYAKSYESMRKINKRRWGTDESQATF